MKKLYIIILCILHIAYSIDLKSQVTVSATIDSVQIFIGQQTNLSIKAVQPKDLALQFPLFSDTIVNQLEIVSIATPDTLTLGNGLQQITHQYTVTAFDSTLIFLPGFELSDTEHTYRTNPISLKVVDMPIDTTQQAITDIKNVYKAPIDWIYILTIVFSVLLAILLLAIVIYLAHKYLKHPKEQDEEAKEPIDPRKAHEIAYDELASLKEKQLWQAQQFKLYYTELTEILRRYVYNRYTIGAMEQTTDEILADFRQSKELKEKKEEIKLLAEVLQLADLVKFAKFQPIPDECEHSFLQVEQFVDLTKELEPTQNEEDKNLTQNEQSE